MRVADAGIIPQVEELEARRVPSGLPFRFTLNDPQRQFDAFPQLMNNLQAAGQILSSVIDGKGMMEVSVVPSNAIDRAAGQAVRLFGVGVDSQGFQVVEYATIAESRTGYDPNGAEPDMVLYFNTQSYLPTVFFDPSGASRTAPVPADKVDLISVALHELIHGLGIVGFRGVNAADYGKFTGLMKTTWDIQTAFGAGGDARILYFTGSQARAVYGGAVPLLSVGPGQALANENFDHVANPAGRPGADLAADLMNGVHFMEGTRYTVSPLDLALLADLGVGRLPTFELGSSSYRVDQQPGKALTVTVIRNFGGGEATVDYATSNGDAIAGQHYVSVFGTLRFAVGESTKTITIPIVNDVSFEGSRSFKIVLRNPSNNAVLGLSSAASVTIRDGSLSRASRRTLVTGADAGGGPQVRVIDALSRAERSVFFAYDPEFTGGVRVATGDVNGDGMVDVITAPGPGGGPDIHVYDGVTGRLIRQFFAYDIGFSGGVYVAAGDINGDGFADIICGADAGGGPNVTVFSGLDQKRLHSLFAYDPQFSGGVRVAAGDVDDDGLADIICGAGPGGGPNVTVFKGLTGGRIQSFFVYDQRFTPGIYVAAADVNGDHVSDIITGAGAGGGPNVAVFDGASLARLQSFFSFDIEFVGGVRVASTDRNGDGKFEVIAVAGPDGDSTVAVFDGASGLLLDEFVAYDPLFRGGLFIGGSS